MSRWKPDARSRLEQAAYELFRDRGYDRTTVVDIAARAGLTERTFFRHYADKREVLFARGAVALQDELVAALAAVPPSASPIDVIRVAVEAMSRLMHGHRERAREVDRIVAANADLRERSLIKRAALTAALAQALERRGIATAAARVGAELGITVFYVGFDDWLDDPAGPELVEIVHRGFDQLKAVVTGT